MLETSIFAEFELNYVGFAKFVLLMFYSEAQWKKHDV